MLPSDSRTKTVFHSSQTGKRLHWVVAQLIVMWLVPAKMGSCASKLSIEGTVASERLRAAVTEAKRDSRSGLSINGRGKLKIFQGIFVHQTLVLSGRLQLAEGINHLSR